MRKWMVAAMAVMAASMAQAAEMDASHCKYPEAPAVPDGATATEAEMGQAGAAVRQFVADVESSLQCLTGVEESLGNEITEEQQAALVGVYNQGVDQMNAVVENYNQQVKAFRGE